MVGGKGANYDQSPTELDPRAWSNIRNARFTRNRIERFGGSAIFSEAPGTTELTGARFISGIIRNGSEGLLLLTATNAYFTINGSTWQDVTPAVGWADTTTWNMNQYGDWLIITSLDTEPFVLAPNGAQFVPFANWATQKTNYQVQRIVPYKNILVGIGVEISNQPQSGLVIWSDVVSPATLDQVNWNPADPTSLAGENTLPDRDGELRDAGVLRDSLVMYTDASVWRADLSSTVVGVTPTVFNFRKVFSHDGIFKNRCFVEQGGYHYVVGLYDIYRHDMVSPVSLSDNRCTEFFYQRIGTGAECFVEHYQRPQEIIINYSVDTDSQAREALVYNYFYDTWSRWIFSDTAGFYTHFTTGPDFGLSVPTWADLQTAGTLWSDLNATTWNDLFPQNRNRVPYILGGDKLYRVDAVGSASSVTPSEALLERIDLDLDEVFGGVHVVKHIDQLQPIVVGDGELRIQIGGRDNLGAPVVWEPEGTYDLLSDYKFDTRVTWRYPAIRIIQDAADGTFALSGIDWSVHAESMR
jgi:hypothetical protein